MTREEAIREVKHMWFRAKTNSDEQEAIGIVLEEIERYIFEINECKAILDHPTPDVTENDKKRAMYVLQTFPDKR